MRTSDDVDSGVWDVVQAINQTCWAWTRYCCEGHWDVDEDTYLCDPYLQIVCQQADLGRAMEAASRAMALSLEVGPALRASFSVTPASPGGVACTLHVNDPGETGQETLGAAREVVGEFGRWLAQSTDARVGSDGGGLVVPSPGSVAVRAPL